MKTKILIVGFTSGVGGVETFICNILTHINKAIFEVDLMLFQETNIKYRRILKQYADHIYRVTSFRSNPIKCLYSVINFYKNHHDYSIIHLNECTAKLFIYCWPVFFYKNMKLIVHSHNGDNQGSAVHWFMRKMQSWVTDEQWACSSAAAEWMFNPIAIHKYGVKKIFNGIDLEPYRFNIEQRKRYRKKYFLDNKIVLGSIARFEKQKNHALLIQIFKQFVKTYPESCLVLVGDGALKESILEDISAMGLSDKVLYLGIRDDIPEILQMLDVFLLPSLYEGLPFVGIEAQASGLPVVASNTVSKEMELTSLISWVELKAPLKQWVEAIEKSLQVGCSLRGSKVAELAVAKSGFNITNSIQMIEKYYLDLSVGKEYKT